MPIIKIFIRILSVVILVPVILGGALFWLNDRGYFNLGRIEVLVDDGQLESHYLKPQMEVVEKMIETFRGQSLWRMDLSELRSQILSLNWVDQVSLVRQWPSTLKAKIKPLDVKMILLTKKGQFLPVVKNGETLNPLEIKHIPNATILRGENFQKNLALRKKAVEVWDSLPSEGSFSRNQISEMFFKDKEGFWVTLIKTGTEVRLGNEAFPMKSARVSQVLNYLQSHQLEGRVIDADLSQKVLVRMRKDP